MNWVWIAVEKLWIGEDRGQKTEIRVNGWTRGLILVILILLCSWNGKTQQPPVAEIFNDAVQSLRETPVIYYIDSSIDFTTSMRDYSEKRQWIGYSSTKKGKEVTINLSKRELKELDQKMKLQKKIEWPADLLPNARRLCIDSIKGFTSYLYTRELQQPIQYRWYYYFSQPVTTRNGNFAFVRLASMIDHSSGYDYLFVYEKVGGGWKRKMVINSGAW